MWLADNLDSNRTWTPHKFWILKDHFHKYCPELRGSLIEILPPHNFFTSNKIGVKNVCRKNLLCCFCSRDTEAENVFTNLFKMTAAQTIFTRRSEPGHLVFPSILYFPECTELLSLYRFVLLPVLTGSTGAAALRMRAPRCGCSDWVAPIRSDRPPTPRLPSLRPSTIPASRSRLGSAHRVILVFWMWSFLI